jgi:hypothetical protein
MVNAPALTLMLGRAHYPKVESGATAILRKATDVVQVSPGGDVTIRSRWESPPVVDLAVRLVETDGRPIEGWYVDWSFNSDTCGPPIQVEGPSDADGWIRFEAPVELTAAMAVYDSDVRGGGPWGQRGWSAGCRWSRCGGWRGRNRSRCGWSGSLGLDGNADGVGVEARVSPRLVNAPSCA